MSNIKERLDEITGILPQSVRLVAVSKTKPMGDIQEAYDWGQRIFGENKVQELADKYEALPKDIEWHMIGHLQTNKVKYIASFVSLIHAVDSLKLLEVINQEGQKYNRIINCLLQFHIATEDTKFGLDYNEAVELLESAQYAAMQNIRIVGVMGMATYTDDTQRVRAEFHYLREIFCRLKQSYFSAGETFKELSMGMSGDYKIAVEEGSTLVRIGSSIFGERNYSKIN